LDTSVVIDLGRLDPAGLPDIALISAVTLAELAAGPLVATDPVQRAAREARLRQAEQDFDPLPFDAAAARVFGQVAADLRATRRTVRARSYDAMIAATAIAHALPLYTLNPVDLVGISGLDVRVPRLAV